MCEAIAWIERESHRVAVRPWAGRVVRKRTPGIAASLALSGTTIARMTPKLPDTTLQ